MKRFKARKLWQIVRPPVWAAWTGLVLCLVFACDSQTDPSADAATQPTDVAPTLDLIVQTERATPEAKDGQVWGCMGRPPQTASHKTLSAIADAVGLHSDINNRIARALPTSVQNFLFEPSAPNHRK